MPIITTDDRTASEMAAARDITEVRAPDGRLLGLFAPDTNEEASLYLHAWLTLDRRAIEQQKQKSELTYSYAEVKARIGMGDSP